MPKLSIIVPVYNVEPYLCRCVDSILTQTFTDFECILVDDGSSDGCGAICDEYAKKDTRVVVIHQENGGLSAARNAGLDIAQGEYIGFVDSDDFIASDMYRAMLHKAEQCKAEIVACGVENIDESLQSCSVWPPKEIEIVFGREDFISHFYPDVRRAIMPSVCNKVFFAPLFYGIRFPVGRAYEDEFIQLRLYDECSKIAVIRGWHYKYFHVREGSILNSPYGKKRMDLMDMAFQQYQFFVEKDIVEQQHYTMVAYLNNYMYNFFGVKFILPELQTSFKKYEKQFIKMLPKILKNPKVCRLKKLAVLLMLLNKKLSRKLCQTYFPECLPEFLRNQSERVN